MLIMKDNKIGAARVKVAASPSYTVAELHDLGREFIREKNSEHGSTNKLALATGLFLAWLAKREREGRG